MNRLEITRVGNQVGYHIILRNMVNILEMGTMKLSHDHLSTKSEKFDHRMVIMFRE